MFENFKKAYLLLSIDLRKKLFLIGMLLTFAMILEALSIGIIVPFLSYFFSTSFNNLYFNELMTSLEQITSFNTLTILLILIFIVFLSKNLFLIFNHYINSKFIEKVKFEIANKRFKNYLNKDYNFFLQNNTSALFRNVTTEIGSLVEFLSSSLILIGEISIFFGITMLLLIVDFKSTLIVATVAALFGFTIIYLTKKKLVIMGKDRIYIDGQINKYFLQGLAAAKDVKLLKVEDSLIYNTKYFLKKSFKINLFFRFLNGIIKYLFELIIITLFVVVVISLSKLQFDYNYILKTCALFGVASFRILPSVSRISTSIQQIKFRERTVNNLYDEFQLNIKNSNLNNFVIKEDSYTKTNPIKLKKKIFIKNLNFKYKVDGELVLKNVNFEINKGEFFGIYGESGTGKTTLINILIGLLKTRQIFCDENNIQNNINSWQKNIGYVSQDTYLIDDTIKRNIAFGIQDNLIDKFKISNCLEKSQLTDFINFLPNKLESTVGEKGIEISGGQKQRIGIARALYHEPEILVLDEATSSLDNNTEKNLLNSIKKLRGNKTIIFVTHKHAIINECDRVLQLENGKIKYIGEPKKI